MKLTPDDSWRWYFDTEQARLMLDLANGMVFRSRFSSSMLTPDAFTPSVFCVEDAALFFTYQEKCQTLALSAEARAELVLNALVANRFLKPMMPKSWHFAAQPRAQAVVQTGDQVSVQLNERAEAANFMVVEAGDKASLCVLAQGQLTLSGKAMQLGDAIKIMHDRLSPAMEENDETSARYAFAG
ncbi:cell division protein ZapC [Dickeya zeae]|uniref:cell division protein ZapC n=1 Tax=Dickeya zeae TaxID=204042 RepID=UPI001CFC45B7|nr:cell division protein ZapC [Dickeya zeae]UCZ74827.1 cell division protein ZapC [Dickeya zeae]